MSLQKFKAFVTTVELGSISQAAQQLGYTQSAVSRMIVDLETQWGMELLYRGKGGVQLTSAGQQLLPVLRTITDDHRLLENTVREMQGMQTGLLQLGTFTTAADRWIPDLLKAFAREYPHIAFKLRNSESYDEIQEWIRQGQVDCGFVRLPAPNDLQAVLLKKDMLVAVLPEDHPLAGETVITEEQLCEESLIKLQMDREIELFLAHLPKEPKIAYEVSSDHTVLSMVENGMGISIMHSLIADTDRYRVVWKVLERPSIREIGVAVPKNARLTTPVKTFVDFISRYENEKQNRGKVVDKDV